MAALSIHEPKMVVDVVPAIFDFTSDLESGETISSAVCAVSVFTGQDSSPEDLLYQTVIITGNICEQKIQKGIPGVVYDILLTVITSTGRDVEQVTRIAILPDAKPAVPVYIPLYLSTPPYPVDQTDEYQSFSIASFGGRLQLQPTFMDAVLGTASNISIDLYGGGVSYRIPYDAIMGHPLDISIDLYGSGVTYSIPGEGVYGTTSGISIDLYGSGVSYDIPYEAIIGTISSITFGLV